MQTKTLDTIQTLAKIGRVLSKIVFIFSLIGAIGFVSSAKFSQAFKAKFGLTPTEYRRQTQGI